MPENIKPQFTLITDKKVYRVNAVSEYKIRQACREIGMTVVGIYRDGDRVTSMGWAFGNATSL